MRKLNEETALAIIFGNTRRKPENRKEDILTIAHCFEYLVKLYGSRKTVSEKTGLSDEMIRQFLTALKLPKEIQNMIAERKIDSVDAIRNLATLEEIKQIETAKVYTKSQSKDARDIKRLLNEGKLDVKEAKNLIDKAKPKKFHVFIMDFDDTIYKDIIKNAKLHKMRPAELVREIVAEWLNKNQDRKDN